MHTPSICNSVCVLFHVLSSGLQDFANQVKYSQRYAEALKRTNSKAGKYVSPTTGEYFSGLGLPVSLEFGAQVMLLEVSPKGGRAWSPIAWTKLLFDGSFLIKTSRRESLSQLMWMQCFSLAGNRQQNGGSVPLYRRCWFRAGAGQAWFSGTEQVLSSCKLSDASVELMRCWDEISPSDSIVWL